MLKEMSRIIQAGDIWLERLKTKSGEYRERPILVISANLELNMILAVRLSSKRAIPSKLLVRLSGLNLQHEIYADVRTAVVLSHTQLFEKIDNATHQDLEAVRERVRSLSDDSFNRLNLHMSASEILEKSDGRTASEILEQESKEAKLNDKFDIFLSHSYLDANEILALKKYIEEVGFTVYVDWIVDRHRKREHVDRETAEVLRNRMCNCKCMIYATSSNSRSSRWMPWELGFFDGTNGNIAILPIRRTHRSRNFSGEEYLQLYSYVLKNDPKSMTVIDEGKIAMDFVQWLHSRSKTHRGRQLSTRGKYRRRSMSFT